MADWAKKRFWKKAEVTEAGNGMFGVALDGRAVKTPLKSPLNVPGREMAEAIAAEWNAQEGEIDPLSMPCTRSANAAIDKVALQHAEVADMLAEYGGTDLLCYRATSPQELVSRQAAAWDPMLDWAETALGARLRVASGVMHVAQDQAALDRLRARVHGFSEFELAAFHDLVTISGSLVLAFAVTEGVKPAEDIWKLSRLDESWQEEQWGEDDEASTLAESKRIAFHHANRFYRMAKKLS